MNHFLAPVHAEIDVDIRHGDALGIQETLKQEIIFQRVDIGNAQTVGHQAAGGRAPPRSHRDALIASVADKVPDNQKIARVATGANNLQLFLQARLIVALRIRQATFTLLMCFKTGLQPLLHHLLEIIIQGQITRGFVERQHQRIKRQFDIAALGDFQRAAARLRVLPEDLVHLLRRFDVVLLWIVAHAFGIVVTLARANAEQDIVRYSITGAQVVAIVGRHERHVHILAKIDQLSVDLRLRFQPMGHDLQVIVIRTENLAVTINGICRLFNLIVHDVAIGLALEAPGERDEALGVFSQGRFIDPRLVVKAVDISRAQQSRQILVTGKILGQQRQMIRHAAAFGHRPIKARARRDIGLAAQDWLDALALGRLVKFHGPKHVAMIGHGNRWHAEFCRSLYQFANTVRPVQQAVFRVQM